MKRKRVGVVRLAAGFSLLLALLAATVSAGSAQSADASLTIHNRLCPTEYSGDDIFGDCHGTAQDSNLEFSIDGPASDSGATDDNGDITFAGLSAGTYTISGGVPGEFASTQVYCSIEDDPDAAIAVTGTATGVSIDLPESTNVVCDWYNIPFDLRGDDGDDDGDDDDDGGVTTLPSTGAGVTSDAANNGWFLGGAALLAACGLAVVSRRRAFTL